MSLRKDILIVSDSRYEMDNIQELLLPEFGPVEKTIFEEEGVKLFKANKPNLLILAYEEVSQAESFYLSLYDHEHDGESTHKTLLLCRGQQSQQAYELCFNGIMDDYVADRPLFDPHRLLLSVRNALDSHSTEQRATWFMQQIEKSRNDLQSFDSFIHNHLSSLNNANNEVQLQFESYLERLKRDLFQLEDRIAPSLDGIDEPTTRLSDTLQEFCEKSIDDGSEEVKASVKNVGEQHNQLNEDINKFLSVIGKKKEQKKRLPRILIIDDDPMYKAIIEAMLESEPYEVHSVDDGKFALERIVESPPDVILLDYMMPDVNGLMVLKKIKSDPYTSHIPVIMLTGDASRTVVASCIKNGAAEYIIKPGSKSQIIEKINTLLLQNHND